jgi:uncharacterized membrane protein YqaE (UPF0057 family)
MKQIKKLLFVVLVSTFALNANAAFVVKNEAKQEILSGNIATTEVKQVKEHKVSKIEKLILKKITKADGSSKISKGIYILLALFGLGWLGMGLNSNFEGSDWIISLVLYLLLWLPGFIYTLIKMKNYYK